MERIGVPFSASCGYNHGLFWRANADSGRERGIRLRRARFIMDDAMHEDNLNPSTPNISPCPSGIRDCAETRPPRILIVRLSAIGDVIHGIPVLCALRAALPTAFLAWVV